MSEQRLTLASIESTVHAADWLAGVAERLRERLGGRPAKIIVLYSTAEGGAELVHYVASPAIARPSEFVGLCELGKLTYLGDLDTPP
jgi:hypothetical protein